MTLHESLRTDVYAVSIALTFRFSAHYAHAVCDTICYRRTISCNTVTRRSEEETERNAFL